MADQISNAPPRADLIHRQGSVQTFEVKFKLADGTPIPITGKTYTLNVRKTVNSDPVLATYGMGTGLVITDGPGGVLEVTLDDVTSPLQKGDWVYDLDEDTGGTVIPVVAGAFCIPGDL